MGCHTWYSVPYKTDKEEIIKLAIEGLLYNKEKGYMTDDNIKMYQLAIENELVEVICNLAGSKLGCDEYLGENGEYILYKSANEVAFEKFNKEFGYSYNEDELKISTENNIEIR